MRLLIIFILLNIANVVIQTIKSIATIKCGKGIAALINAVAFGLYTVVTVYMLCDLSLGLKALIVAVCNLIGVYAVKWVEEKKRKEQLWKIEMCVLNRHSEPLENALDKRGVSYNYIPVGKYTTFNCFAETQKESAFIKELCDKYHAKYFVSETKIL